MTIHLPLLQEISRLPCPWANCHQAVVILWDQHSRIWFWLHHTKAVMYFWRWDMTFLVVSNVLNMAFIICLYFPRRITMFYHCVGLDYKWECPVQPPDHLHPMSQKSPVIMMAWWSRWKVPHQMTSLLNVSTWVTQHLLLPVMHPSHPRRYLYWSSSIWCHTSLCDVTLLWIKTSANKI